MIPTHSTNHGRVTEVFNENILEEESPVLLFLIDSSTLNATKPKDPICTLFEKQDEQLKRVEAKISFGLYWLRISRKAI